VAPGELLRSPQGGGEPQLRNPAFDAVQWVGMLFVVMNL